VIGFSGGFFSILALFLVILGSLAAGGAPFRPQTVLGLGSRLDLRNSMLKLVQIVPLLNQPK
jgi:hypothetical protein